MKGEVTEQQQAPGEGWSQAPAPPARLNLLGKWFSECEVICREVDVHSWVPTTKPAREQPTANAWATGILRGFLQKCPLGGALLGQSAWHPPKPTGESSRELARAPWEGSQLGARVPANTAPAPRLCFPGLKLFPCTALLLLCTLRVLGAPPFATLGSLFPPQTSPSCAVGAALG